MKRIILILIIAAFVSCEKEPLECNCGKASNLIMFKDPLPPFEQYYMADVKNECSGNTKKMVVYPYSFMQAYVHGQDTLCFYESW